MPEQAAEARAEQSSVLAGVVHEKFIDPFLGEWLLELSHNSDSLSATEAAIIRERLRDYEKAIKLPPDLVQKLAHTSSSAQSVWIKARKESDFSKFAPWLEKMVGLKREQAEAYGYEDCPYDPLLDDYEPHMTSAELDPILESLRDGLVPIVAAIRESSVKVDDGILRRRYPATKQELFCREIMKIMGVNTRASRLDKSAHPFCAGIHSPTDVRITTRYDEQYLPQALYSVMHESGHCLYEQGLDEKFVGTPLGESLSLGIHESQSRLWENMVGRSKSFVAFLFPKLRSQFPEAMTGITHGHFYHAINRVVPSTIRVEADEVTYSLHVILRYEIEKSLLDDEIRVKDLPHVWNEKMRKYLGIVPKNDAEGVLQDTHWASGIFGYFPTYVLGNLYGAQFWDALKRDLENVDSMMEHGELASILQWLHNHIHRHGRRHPATELIKRATGKKLSAEYFLNYLKGKFGEIYRIKHWS